MVNKINVAVDGPAGAGKSTVAKLVAEQLSLLYIDTGAMYRSLAYSALESHIDLQDSGAIKDLLVQLSIKLVNDSEKSTVFVNDQDVSVEIRTPEVTRSVPIVASHESVRLEMLKRQRKLAIGENSILDGRDIGTHVLPDAQVKVFLTATVDIRAERRHEELLKRGFSSNLDQLKEEIAKRDELDATREVAPLRKAEDAIVIDATTLSIPEVVDAIVNLINIPVSQD
ncbi:(d)CMP kinase [Halalkalibacter okhensis]|uniref:Cytidylate kinase n=1 Tax=Halalkalibacter okhensis TaxID=333138 RepID=A0A0B0IGC0_9BACI|nr:(d)CMP kinase [Halalkalibacter okhensis]KHF38721.1 cytidylate kinase [Halalkalibacter okhensis]